MRFVRLAAPVAWALLLLFLGRRPGDDFPETGLLALPGADKVAHLCAYGILGLLAGWAAPRRALAVAIVAALLVGAVDEWSQGAVSGRTASGLDLLADLAGAALGGLLARRTLRRPARSP